MKTFKVIVAWAAAVLAVIGLIAALLGLGGSWVLRNRVTDVTLRLLTAAENVVEFSSSTLQQVDGRLDQAVGRVDDIESKVVNLGTNLEENSLVVTAVSAAFGEELGPIINEARVKIQTMQETIFAIDDAITAANEIPFVNLDGLFPTLINDLADSLVALDQEIQETRTAVRDRREELINGGVTVVTDRTSKITTGLENVQGTINAADAELAVSANKLAEQKVSLPRTFTLITLALNLVLLLIGIAFISLFLHAYSYIKNPEQSFKELVA